MGLDLRQLKPVCASAVFSNVKSEFGDLIGNPLWEEFQSYELDEIMRQKNDKEFADALNRLSRGVMNDEDVKMFKSREIRNTGPPPTRCIHLYKDNKRVGEYNTLALNAIKEEIAVFTALDICQGRGKPEWKKALLESVKELTTAETMGLPQTLQLKVTAVYMLTCNLDTSDGLVNGSLGSLSKISYGVTADKQTRPTVAWLKFKDKDVGKKRMRNMRSVLVREGVKGLVPIKLEQRSIKTWPGRDLQVCESKFIRL